MTDIRPESGWLDSTRKVPPLVDERHRPTSRDVKPACGGPSPRARRCFSRRNLCRAARVHRGMRPFPVLAAVAGAAATLIAAGPASAATWTAPVSISAPRTFISPLEAGATGNGSVVLDGAHPEAPASAGRP